MIIAAELSLWVAFLMAAWTVIVSSIGGSTRRPELIESGNRGVHAVLLLLLTASAGLWAALLTRDFSLWYVASHTSANLPGIYTISAFWAGRGGSLLLWTVILAAYAVIALSLDRDRAGEPYVAAVLAAVMLVFTTSIALAENPFERLSWMPPEGAGMEPRLQSPWMAIYLPMLYLGYAATAVPFAFTVSALFTRRITPEWLARSRRWATVSWLFMSAGILVGLHWSYMEPDGPGHWLRHPVESAALLPWLVMTAFLFSVAVQDARGIVMKWNVILLMSAFLLAIFATVSPGTGTLTGVRPLTQSPGGSWIVAAFAATIVISGIVVIERVSDLTVRASGSSATAPARTRYGAYMAAVGLVAFSVAVAAQLFRKERDVTLVPGNPVELTDPYGSEWRFLSEGVSRYLILNRRVTAVTIPVHHNGMQSGLLTTEHRQHVDSRGARTYDPSSEPGVVRTMRQDVYAVLVGMAGEDAVEVRIAFNPLVWLVWSGGAVGVIGGVLAFWPRRVAPRVAEAAI